MSVNILEAVIKLAAIKQLDKDQIKEIILETIVSTMSKRLEPENDLEVFFNDATGSLTVKFLAKVVESEPKFGELDLSDARKYHDKYAQLGQFIPIEMMLSEFEPKLIKTTQKIIADKIHMMEEERVKSDFNKQKNTIVTGRIKSIDNNGGYRIDIGYTEALLPVDEQIENEFYKIGDMIKAYVVNIRSKESGVTVILSRTNPEFVKKLFESEISEVYQGLIRIRKIVRDPGVRTKVELETDDPKLDIISCCIGLKGSKIDLIRKELHGEQIDIVVYSDNVDKLIMNALGVECIKKVIIERNKTASVIVDDNEKVTAIGKQGKNVKLAAKLTGMKIDIYTQAEYEEKMSKERRTISHITDLDGVTPKISEILRKAGYTSVQDIFMASVDELCNLEGIGQKTAEKLKESAVLF